MTCRLWTFAAACVLAMARLGAHTPGESAAPASLSAATPSAAAPAATSAAPARATQAQAVQIKSAWIRWLPGGVPLAGYATLANATDQPLVLTSVTSAEFHDLSVHQTVQSSGTVRMSPLERLTIAPHSTLDFESAGIHLMLMQPHATLERQTLVPMTLHFADGSLLTVQFQVRTSLDMPPPG